MKLISFFTVLMLAVYANAAGTDAQNTTAPTPTASEDAHAGMSDDMHKAMHTKEAKKMEKQAMKKMAKHMKNHGMKNHGMKKHEMKNMPASSTHTEGMGAPAGEATPTTGETTDEVTGH